MEYKVNIQTREGQVATPGDGVTRLLDEKPEPSIKVNRGTLHFQLDGQGGSTTTLRGPVSIGESDILRDRGPGIMDTLHIPGGTPTTDTGPNSLITVMGQEMTLEVAARLGYVKKVGPGQYEDALIDTSSLKKSLSGTDAPAAPDADPEEHEPNVPLSSEAHEAVDEVYNTFGPGGAEQFAHSIINSIGRDPGDQRGIERFAQDQRLKPEVVEAKAHKLYQHFRTQAEEYMTKRSGESGKAIMEWAMEEVHPESLQELARLHVFGGDLSVYDALIKEYKHYYGPGTYRSGH